MAEERDLTVDLVGFNTAMDEAREKSRTAGNKVFAYSFTKDYSLIEIFTILCCRPFGCLKLALLC